MKYKVLFPLRGIQDYGSDKLTLQLYDKDIIKNDELIGETQFDLNCHNMIAKACKRMKAVEVCMRITNRGGEITNMIWVDVYNPKFKDNLGNKISQGKVLISVELLPILEADKKINSLGRDNPNNFP